MVNDNHEPNTSMVDEPTKFHDEFPDRLKIYEKNHPIKAAILRGKKKRKKRKKK